MSDDAILLRELLRVSLAGFVERVFETVNPNQNFHPNWHIKAICRALRDPEGSRRLIVNLPPRALKSLIVSVAWPAWLLGHNPSLRIVCVSYSDELAKRLARDFRRVIEAGWYRELFPAMRIDERKNTESEVVTRAGGSRYATSVGGTLTGRGGNLIVIDDPIKPKDAINSEAERNAVNEWFDHTLLSRLDDPSGGRIVVVMQRVHEADLSGHLIEKGGWTVLRLPAIAIEQEEIAIAAGKTHLRQPGDVLEPERVPRGHLEALRSSIGSMVFAAQYQQDPVPAGGHIFKRDWLAFYDAPPTEGQIVQSWDAAAKEGAGNDWSVCTTWRLAQKRYYLLDVLRLRVEFTRLLHHVQEQARLHRAGAILVEDASNGTPLAQTLRGGSHNVIAIKPVGDKETRALQGTPVFESGRVVLPREAPWLAEYQRELLGFPAGRHDDQVDSTSQFLIWAEERARRPPVLIVAPGGLERESIWCDPRSSRW